MIPAGPLCVRCHHSPCPCCVTSEAAWCDLVDDDAELCCGGACVYEDFAAVQAWSSDVAPLMAQPLTSFCIEGQDGPVVPLAEELD